VLEKIYSLYRQFSDAMGLFFDSGKKKIPTEVMRLVEEREAARKSKNWTVSDAIREKIKSLGYIVQDTKEGPNIKEAEES
jgi:cysteinyl-tRNA synthetase